MLYSYSTVSSNGSVTPSEITVFLKKQHTVTTMYRSITTTWNTTITLSGNHLIFARRNLTHKFSPMQVHQKQFILRLMKFENR